jgi:endonuclease-3
MDKKTSAGIISRLRKRYGQVSPALDYRSVYELSIAVVLSAQTTDRQVNLVTPELFRRYPDLNALAQAPLTELESLVHSTGFYKMKAAHISGLAKKAVDKFGGEIPGDRESLESLPGVGRKSASVILSQGFGIPAIAVDTHVGRLARRLGYTAEKNPLAVEKALCAVIPEKDWTEAHLLLISHGRQICFARKPGCDRCPVKGLCPSRIL